MYSQLIISDQRGMYNVAPLAQVTTAADPREKNSHAEAMIPLSWARTIQPNTNKKHISDRISDSHLTSININ